MTEAYPDALPAQYQLHWYLLERVLGQGGFGITYLARDTNLDQKVAIKEYLPVDVATRRADATVRARSDEQTERYRWGLDRFIREARTLARFDHPNIVRVLSVFEQHGTAYMVMRFEEGENFAALLERKRTLAEADLMRVLLPVLEGLELVHNAGFIHRDIKPDNIHIRADGTPVLLDFGSARMALGQSRTMTILVAPGYAPFEQYYSSGDDQGPWSDIYSLGATCYRAIAGVPPMDAIARSKGILGSAREILVPATAVGQGRYSERLLKAVDHALAFSENDRPQTIAEWREELVGSQDQARPVRASTTPPTPSAKPRPEPPAAPPTPPNLDSVPPAATGRSSRPSTSTGWIVASVLVGALLGAGIGAYTGIRWASQNFGSASDEVRKARKEAEDARAKAEAAERAREKAEADKARVEDLAARAKADVERLVREKAAADRALTDATARATSEAARADREQKATARGQAEIEKLNVKLALANKEIARLKGQIKPPPSPAPGTAPTPEPPVPAFGSDSDRFDYYKKRAQQGDANAAFLLGGMYEAGRGVAQSNNWAYTWYSIADRRGVAAAKPKKDAVARKLQPMEITQADRLVEGLVGGTK
jgi:serine/threonine protein kinase